MKSFNIEASISGKQEKLLVVPINHSDRTYRIISNGVELCTLKENGEMGWEVSGTALDADELNTIGQQIKERA